VVKKERGYADNIVMVRVFIFMPVIYASSPRL
jgi:hypothetical protein